MADIAPWGADVAISLPEPLSRADAVQIDMGGFGFTTNGIAHQFRESDLEAYLPTFAPMQRDTP